jgi:hypothetical protein
MGLQGAKPIAWVQGYALVISFPASPPQAAPSFMKIDSLLAQASN